MDSITVVDLRQLSQADLSALSLSSPDAFDLRRCDDVVTPRIDRSVFNESAGSRKQTFSRLRLAPRNPDPLKSSPLPTPPPSSRSREDDAIISALRRLFSPPLPPRQTLPAAELVPYDPQPPLSQTLPLVTLAAPSCDLQDMEIMNAKGVAVDLMVLRNMEDPFIAEVKRRTEGLNTVNGLLGFMTGLDGQWGSQRKKKKIVDSATFGDHLPRGWKILLGIRRKEGIARMDCRRYISPSGKRFKTCGEVSSYIISLIRPQDATHQAPSQKTDAVSLNILDQEKPSSPALGENTPGKSSCSYVDPSMSSHHLKKLPFVKLGEVAKTDTADCILECRKCNLRFDENHEYLQHLLTFHQRSAKRRKLITTISDGVIIKDGKYECQICHKSFTERRSYNGHVGSHVRYQASSPGALPNGIETKVMNPPPPLPLVVHVLHGVDTMEENEKSILILDAAKSKFEEAQMLDSDEVQRNLEKDSINKISKKGKSAGEQRGECDVFSLRSEEIHSIMRNVGSNDNPNTTPVPSANLNGAFKNTSTGTIQNSPKNTSLVQISYEMSRHEMSGISGASTIREYQPLACPQYSTADMMNVPHNSGDKSRGTESINGHIEDFKLSNCAPEEFPFPNRKADISLSHCKVDSPCSETSDVADQRCFNLSDTEEGTRGPKVETSDHINSVSAVCGITEGLNANNVMRKPVDDDNELCDDFANQPNKIPPASGILGVELVCSGSFSLSYVDLSDARILDTGKYNPDQTIDFSSHLTSLSVCEVSDTIEQEKNGVCASRNDACVAENPSTIELGDYFCISNALSDKDADTNCSGFDFDITSEQEIDIQCCNLSLVGNWEARGKDSSANNVQGKSFHGEANGLGGELVCFSNSTKTVFSEFDAYDTTHISSINGTFHLNASNVSSSWGPSSDLSTIDLIPEQRGYEPNDHREKHGNMLGSELLSIGRIEPSDLALFSGQESRPPPVQAMDLDLVLGGRYCDDLPGQLEWVGMSPRMAGGCVPHCVLCMWCGKEISIEGVGDGEMPPDSMGFMCLGCKGKLPR